MAEPHRLFTLFEAFGGIMLEPDRPTDALMDIYDNSPTLHDLPGDQVHTIMALVASPDLVRTQTIEAIPHESGHGHEITYFPSGERIWIEGVTVRSLRNIGLDPKVESGLPLIRLLEEESKNRKNSDVM